MEPEPEPTAISPPDPRREAYDFVRRGPYLGASAEIGASELDIALQRIGIKLEEALSTTSATVDVKDGESKV